MTDDLLSSIVDATEGGAAPPPAPSAGSIAAIIGQVAAAGASARARLAAHDTAPLLHLTPAGWRTVVRYLDPDDLAAVVAQADVTIAGRLANALDADGRAWLVAQADSMAAVTGERHHAALSRLLSLVARLRAEGRVQLAAEPVAADAPDEPAPPPAPQVASPSAPDAPAPAADGLMLSTRMGVGPRPAAPVERDGVERDSMGLPSTQVSLDPAVTSTDDSLVEALAAVVEASRNAPAANLLAIAEASPHPLLAHGLRLVAAGATAHDIHAAMAVAEEAWLDARRHEAADVRRAVLAVRFGDAAETFRRGGVAVRP